MKKRSRRAAGERSTVVFGLLGPTLDQGRGRARWNRWRPSVDLCRHDDFCIDRFELLHQPEHLDLARIVEADIRSVSPETRVVLHDVPMADPWDFQRVYAALHDFARDYEFGEDPRDYLVHITTGTHVAQICWFLLTESRHVPARLIQSSPPRGRVRNAPDPGNYSIIDLDLSRYDQIASRFQEEREQGLDFLKAGIPTRNPAFNRLIERVEQVGIHSRAPVLLAGPTGVGKTRLARRVYELKKSRRQVEGPFVEVNCATLRGDLAMSTLFGHVKGSFTGATGHREGLLKTADRGVLFLDEIGELGADEQAMLLHAIEDKRFAPLGAEQEVHSDFQLIAGSNRDLREAVRRGRFRDDLLARIDVWTFALPPLRARPEDIEPNLDYELERWSRRTGTRATFNREARQRFMAFAISSEATWDGNFRDFAAAVERMATLAGGRRIDLTIVNEEVERLLATWQASATPQDDPLTGLLPTAAQRDIDRFDLAGLREAVTVCRRARSLSDAGRQLFAASRKRRASTNDADRLRKLLARFGLDWDTIRAAV